MSVLSSITIQAKTVMKDETIVRLAEIDKASRDGDREALLQVALPVAQGFFASAEARRLEAEATLNNSKARLLESEAKLIMARLEEKKFLATVKTPKAKASKTASSLNGVGHYDAE